MQDVETLHHRKGGKPHSMAASLKAGAGVERTASGFDYGAYLPTAIDRGLITEASPDISLVRAFAVRFQLGEFDNQAGVPWSGSAYTLAAQVNDPSHAATARRGSNEGAVLLKNSGGLPVASGAVAVLGHLAAGSAHGDCSPQETPVATLSALDAIEAQYGAANVTYISG
ncbi:MAG: hypothetical protein LBT54_07675, partial [Bifidobacteriaceae bacterium]|nr:hypothetical protein [Bifidobacteriaceae bacterium]